MLNKSRLPKKIMGFLMGTSQEQLAGKLRRTSPKLPQLQREPGRGITPAESTSQPPTRPRFVSFLPAGQLGISNFMAM